MPLSPLIGDQFAGMVVFRFVNIAFAVLTKIAELLRSGHQDTNINPQRNWTVSRCHPLFLYSPVFSRHDNFGRLFFGITWTSTRIISIIALFLHQTASTKFCASIGNRS
jgi:hypothetical protein